MNHSVSFSKNRQNIFPEIMGAPPC